MTETDGRRDTIAIAIHNSADGLIEDDEREELPASTTVFLQVFTGNSTVLPLLSSTTVLKMKFSKIDLRKTRVKIKGDVPFWAPWRFPKNYESDAFLFTLKPAEIPRLLLKNMPLNPWFCIQMAVEDEAWRCLFDL